MEDYPRTLSEFEARFATEAACRAYLCQLRWPDGARCPRCGGARGWPVRQVWWQCAACGHQTSVTAGTIFQDTRSPLVTWFRAIWWVTSQKTGASAAGLQQVLGLGSYQTAWAWLHKLRRAMVRPGRDRLHGRVEVDETYWGAGDDAMHGRRLAERRTLIAIAVEQVGRHRLGRVRLARVAEASANALQAFVDQAIEPGSVVTTDGWSGYGRLADRGYRHRVVVQRGRPQEPTALLPRVHRVTSLLKRWLLGTHQGAVSFAHLDYYLDEFTFRFNRRSSRHRGKLFYRLLEQAVRVPPVPYKTLVGGKPQHLGAT